MFDVEKKSINKNRPHKNIDRSIYMYIMADNDNDGVRRRRIVQQIEK